MSLVKQILPVDLSKGLDEKLRKETAPEATTLQAVYDCVQDETGAWVKRPCLTVVASTTADLTSASLTPFRKLVRTHSGMGVVAGICDFYHFNEATNLFRKKGPAPEMGVKTGSVSSNGADVLANGNTIFGTAETYSYTFVMYDSGDISTGGPNDISIVAYEKAGGHSVKTWSLRSYFTNQSDLIFLTARMVVIDGYYVHVMAVCKDEIFMFHISSLALTNTLAYVTVPPITVGNNHEVLDVVQCYSRSVFMFAEAAAAHHLASFNSAGALLEDVLIAPTGGATRPHSICTDYAYVYWIADDALPVTVIDKVPYNSLATAPTNVATQAVIATAGLTSLMIGSDLSGNLFVVENFLVPPANQVWVTSGITAGNIFSAATTKKFGGWRAASPPFFCFLTLRQYQVWVKSDMAVTVCLDEIVESKAYNTYPNPPDPLRTIKPACVVEPYNFSYSPTPFVGALYPPNGQKVFSYNYRDFMFGYSYRTSTRSNGIAYASMLPLAPTDQWDSDIIGQYVSIGGGVNFLYDGSQSFETAFVDYPIGSATAVATAGVLNGAYKYLFVYRFNDALGNIHYSRVSSVYSASPAGVQVELECSTPSVTSRELAGISPRVITEVYRTAAGGTRYYYLADSRNGGSLRPPNPSAGSLYLLDNTPDATLILNPPLFRQPGTAGTALDRYCPPASSIVVQHSDRIFVADPNGQGRLFFSSFYVDTEGPWFNPAMSIYCHGGSGPITGAASMDGRLVVFKRNAIFVVDGEGPGENGGTGTEFTVQRISSELGCVDGRSIVITPTGIMYRSDRGIEQLSRSLQVEAIGDRVSVSTDSHPYTIGACFDRKTGHANFLVAETETSLVPDNCIVLAFNVYEACWSIKRVTGTAGGDNQEFRDIASGPASNTALGQPIDGVYYISANEFSKEDATTGKDYATYVKQSMETGWVKISGVQGRQRLYDVVVLLKNRDRHRVKLSLAYNYNETYTQSVTFTEAVTDLYPEELSIQPSNQQAIAVKLKIEDVTDTPLGTTFRGFDIVGIAFQVAPKDGTQKLPVDKKG